MYGCAFNAWLLQLEARKSLGAAELYAFYDHGKVKVDARPELVSSPAPDQERAGAGVGIRINEGPMKVNVALAWRTKGGVPTSAANAGSDPRMWMSMMYSF
jgi:hemolysin activation/secretion protein